MLRSLPNKDIHYYCIALYGTLLYKLIDFLFSKLAPFVLDRGEEYMTFEQAVEMLRTELHYPEDRAMHFVKRFDHNGDGRLSYAEFALFKKKIEETLAI